jgi:hypothetical protein
VLHELRRRIEQLPQTVGATEGGCVEDVDLLGRGGLGGSSIAAIQRLAHRRGGRTLPPELLRLAAVAGEELGESFVPPDTAILQPVEVRVPARAVPSALPQAEQAVVEDEQGPVVARVELEPDDGLVLAGEAPRVLEHAPGFEREHLARDLAAVAEVDRDAATDAALERPHRREPAAELGRSVSADQSSSASQA